VKSLGKVINSSKNTNPFNHNTNHMKLYSSIKDGISKDEYGQLINTQYLDDVFNTLPYMENAWKTSSPTGEPLLSDRGKEQLRTQFRQNNDTFDASIALVFGNKTTIGQVCSFAKGLKSNIVTNIPGFCCLDAPYQSKIEEWGEKVSLWDARRLVL
jgi:hypothetical protein